MPGTEKDERTSSGLKKIIVWLTNYLLPKLGYFLKVKKELLQLHWDDRLKPGLSWANWTRE